MINKLPNWDSMIATLPKSHFMQTKEWAEIKAQTGWAPFFRVWFPKNNSQRLNSYQAVEWKDQDQRPAAAALVLQRTLSLGGFSAKLRILYVPKGPLLEWDNASLRRQVLTDLKLLAHRQGAVFIKIDPDVVQGEGLPGSASDFVNASGASVISDLRALGWRLSEEQIQFRNTLQIDLTPNENEILAQMKQKTRYNVRLSERKGVSIRIGNPSDLSMLYQMYAETSIRDGFVIRPADYYYHTWKTFIEAGLAEALIAEFQNEPVAALILFTFAGKAWYVYGMSRETHREKMPNYLLQWHAILHAKQKGCTTYDLWGAPDDFVESDPLWKVYRFKEGLGGKIVRHIGAWDLPTRPTIYHIYTKVLPGILNFLRKKGKAEIKKTFGRRGSV